MACTISYSEPNQVTHEIKNIDHWKVPNHITIYVIYVMVKLLLMCTIKCIGATAKMHQLQRLKTWSYQMFRKNTRQLPTPYDAMRFSKSLFVPHQPNGLIPTHALHMKVGRDTQIMDMLIYWPNFAVVCVGLRQLPMVGTLLTCPRTSVFLPLCVFSFISCEVTEMTLNE